TVDHDGQTKTFKHGDHVTFSTTSGGKQTLTFNGVEFAGYGIVALPNATSNINYNDFAGRDVKGRAVMMFANGTPQILTQGGRGRAGGNRPNYALQTVGAAAVFTYAPAPAPPSPTDQALVQAQQALTQAQEAVAAAQAAARGGAGRGGGRGAAPGGGRAGQAPVAPDITTVLKVDGVVPPTISGDDEFYNFVFGAAKFAELKAKAEKGETLAPVTIPGVKITVNIDNTYEVISTQLSKNVVGMIEGIDPKLKDTYVLFGAHLDHVGYRPSATGRGATQGGTPDLIFSGADDD